ncbi:MAG: hypothetical protein JWM56_992 [Candidatus Peribacteria bacterium]|nr:hypothetical protein [Candidatus Peribacteria bacterium]
MSKKLFVLLAMSALTFAACSKSTPAATDGTPVSSDAAMTDTSSAMADATWAESSDGMWQDSDGKWLKLDNGKLVSSTDGTTWVAVPGGLWRSPDSKWYKVEADGKLMVSADNGQTWAVADTFSGADGMSYKWENGTLMMMKGTATAAVTSADSSAMLDASSSAISAAGDATSAGQ